MKTNWRGQPLHPIDELVDMNYQTTVAERDEAAKQYDLLVGDDPFKASALKSLLKFAATEAMINEAMNNSGADQ